MAGRDYLKGHASTSKAPGNDTAWSGESPGPYIGVVKNNIDPLRMGRLQVNIPSISKTLDPVSGNLVTCEYLSPFYGAKDARHSIPGSTEYEHSQHSYGFWAVPPDIGTRVLVIFAEGKMDQAFWIGCVPDPMTNQMTPGIASSTSTHDALDGTFEGADAGFQDDKKSKYGTTNAPSGEVNRTVKDLKPQQFNTLRRPIHPFAETLLKQGLSADDIRGNTSSSARRETPSHVFGISTPGRKDTTTTKVNVGTKDSTRQDYVTRKTGHTFVMDDGAEDGSNQLTRIRTASGHQILMHDTEGTVYIANGSGKAFIEMEKDGTISVFSDGGINMRTKQDFNLHSDRHVNFHAKGSLNFTAEQNVNLNGGFNVQTMAKNSILNSSQGDLRNYAAVQITSFTRGTQLHGAGGNIDLAGAQVHMNSQGARSGWGPSWLVPEHDHVGIRVSDGLIDIDSRKPLQGGEANKIENSTTVSDFVTHEPYTRTSSTAIRKRYINDILESIESGNPGVSSQDLENIKTRLLARDSIDSVSAELNKIVGVTSDRVSAFASTEINKLVGDNTKLNSSQLNDIQQLLIKPSIASVSGQISKIVGKNVNLANSQLNDIKEKVLANQDVAFISREIKKITGVTGNINLDVSQLKNLKTQLLTKPNIADVTGQIKKIVGDNVKLDLSQLNNVKTKLLANPDVAKLTKQVSGYAKDIVGLSEAVTVNLAALNELKNRALNYKNEIKNMATGFIQGQISQYGQLAFNYAKTAVAQSAFGVAVSSAGRSVGRAVTNFVTNFRWSDSRLKEDIRLVGKSPTGINIYSFKYKQSAGTYEGVMAQEVPWARQMTDTGFYMVDYSKVDVEFRRSN